MVYITIYLKIAKFLIEKLKHFVVILNNTASIVLKFTLGNIHFSLWKSITYDNHYVAMYIPIQI